MTDHTIKETDVSPELFYGDKESCYIRVQYVKDVDGFRFQVRNELINDVENLEDAPKEGMIISAFVRGMLGVAINNSAEIYQIGRRMQEHDKVIAEIETIKDESHRSLMLGEAKGNA